MNFQQKYLKYKLKYNQLKNQLKGGASFYGSDYGASFYGSDYGASSPSSPRSPRSGEVNAAIEAALAAAPLAPIAPPVAYIDPRVIYLTPAQIILLNNIIPLAPAALVPGTRYIEYDTLQGSYRIKRPFMNIVMNNDDKNGYLCFDAGVGATSLSNPAIYRYYNIDDLVPNGLPLPAL